MKQTPQSATFDMNVANETVNVKREFVFKGARISFDIAVPIKGEAGSVTVAQLHQRSVRMAIEMLQGMIPPEK